MCRSRRRLCCLSMGGSMGGSRKEGVWIMAVASVTFGEQIVELTDCATHAVDRVVS